MEDSIRIITERYPEGIIAGLDFTKAFDCLRWNLIFSTLRWFNFGEGFVGIVEILFRDIESCLLNFGHSSGFFCPGRGIRQGCPLSPFLFILVVELLAIKIRAEVNIRGLELRDSTLKVNQFADDLTCFLADEESLRSLFATITEFQGWSGLIINRSKSKLLSPSKEFDPDEKIEGISVVQKIKILGLHFENDNSDEAAYNRNFQHIMDRIKYICGTWSNRNISLKGKVTVINSLVASLLQYPTSVIFTPPRVLAEYRKVILGFLWNNRQPKIALRTLTLPVECGGLKLMDLESRIQVNLLQWIRRVLRNPISNAAATLRDIIGTDSLQSYFACKRDHNQEWIQGQHFYKSLMKVWDKYHGFEPSTNWEVRKEILWQNKHILSGNRPLDRRDWAAAGIVHVSDLCQGESSIFLSHTEVSERFGVTCSFLDILKIRMSIPLHWRKLLTGAPTQTVPHKTDFRIRLQDQQSADASTIGAKALYALINDGREATCTALLRWQENREETTINNTAKWKDI